MRSDGIRGGQGRSAREVESAGARVAKAALVFLAAILVLMVVEAMTR